METKEKNVATPYDLDGKPPLKLAIPLGLQHVLAMFVGNLTPLLIITGVCGIESGSSIQVALLQNALLFQLHGKIQSRLTADAGDDGVGTLVADDLGDIFQRQRLHIHLVGNGGVRHNRGRIGVAEDDLVALLLQPLCYCKGCFRVLPIQETAAP